MLENFKFVREENRLAIVIRFFWKHSSNANLKIFQVILIGHAFPQKITVFQWNQCKIKFSLGFFFASFDSSKAFIGCLEKVQTFVKRICL